MGTNDSVDWRGWMRELGRQFRRMREFLGLSQDQVARMAGVSQGAVSRLEAGRGLATPMLIVLKVHRVLAGALRSVDRTMLDDDLRRSVEIDGLMSPPEGSSGDEPAVPHDGDLEDLIRLYRSLGDGQRRTLVAVLRAAAGSLGKSTPAAQVKA